jgi:hypothetical protein
MKKFLVALSVMLISIGFILAGSAFDPLVIPTKPADQATCIDCFANSITQKNLQLVEDAEICPNSPMIFNEGQSAAVTITPTNTYVVDANGQYVKVGFSKIEQTMTQEINKLVNPGGMTANKAQQAAWVENQGAKEYNPDTLKWDYEGAYIRQNTFQQIYNIDYGYTEKTNTNAIFNADNKLAVLTDNLDVLAKEVGITSTTDNTATSKGTYSNNAEIDAKINSYVAAMT